jgi:hypothetical protein
MKKWILSTLLITGSLVGEVPHEPKIDQLYWVSGWFANELYIRTDNQMWWKVISFESSKPMQWKIGDGVVFSKYPFENPSQYWLINVAHFGGVIVEYHCEPPGFIEQE